jgi:putative phosphoesterase
MLIGLISDTHGLLRPQVFTAFRGVDHILHAGDVGNADILLELSAIAPVTAVWGNTDGLDLRSRLPEIARIELSGLSVMVIHGHQHGSPSASELGASYPDVDLLVFGHSHTPEIERVGRVMVVNPGSAGAARFSLPVSVAVATLSAGEVSVRKVDLVGSKC